VMDGPGRAPKPGLGLGFSGLGLQNPQARPIFKAWAQLGLAWNK